MPHYRISFFLVCIFLFNLKPISGFGQVSVFDTLAAPNDTIVISQLIITGNKITRLSIIERELLIHENDTLEQIVFEKAAERTRENLMNTNLFNFVTISRQLVATNRIVVVIDLKERWYIMPIPIFELVDRNFNEWVKSGDWTRVNYGFYLKIIFLKFQNV